MVTKSYINSITPGPAPVVLHASQYDKLSRTYVFTLTSGGEPFEIPEGALVAVQGTKPDKTGFQYSCTFSGAEVTFRIEDQMTVLAGEIPCELVITQTTASGTAILGTSNFLLIVEEAALADDTVISETDLPLIQEALQVAPEVVASASSAAAARDQAVAAATAAGTSETNAAAAAQTATAAITQIGTSVEQAASSATSASGSATSASESATAAAASATSASGSASDAEAWAVGKRGGVDVPSTDETHENNAKWYAQESSTGGAAALAALSGLTFGQNTDGEWGYKIGGADPVHPFKSIYRENVLEAKSSASGTNSASINFTVETSGQYVIVFASRINTTGGTRTLTVNDEAQTLVTWHSTTGWNLNAYAWTGPLSVGDVVEGRYAVSGASSNGATSIWVARLYT